MANMEMQWVKYVGLVLFLILIMDSLLSVEATTYYNYNRYPYRKKQRNERRVRGIRTNCEESGQCQNKVGIELIMCIRKCMSPECFEELYGHDELEEGEIDVRLNSFKGCVVEHNKP